METFHNLTESSLPTPNHSKCLIYPPPSSITPGNLTALAARALLHKYQPLNEKAPGVAQPASAEAGDFPSFNTGFPSPAMRLPVTLF